VVATSPLPWSATFLSLRDSQNGGKLAGMPTSPMSMVLMVRSKTINALFLKAREVSPFLLSIARDLY